MKIGKRAFDIVFSAVGLVTLSPLLLLIAAAVKLQDGGRVFFLQERAGRGFRPFMLIKFRTMTADAPGRGPSITARGDRRVTRLGSFLRKSKLDELPQLINVLVGDMSLVGPRPEVFRYVNEFKEDFKEVLSVRPGITDYASIMYRDEEGVLGLADDPERLYVTRVLPEKLNLNRVYVRDHSLLKDLKIIFSTFFALFAAGPFQGLKEEVHSGNAPEVRKAEAVKKSHLLPDAVLKARVVIIFTYHFLVVACSQLLVFEMMFNGDVPAQYLRIIPYLTALALVVRLPLFSFFGLYRGLLKYSGIDDLVKIISSVTVGSFVIFAAVVVGAFGKGYPVSAVVLDWLMTIGMICAFRLALRLYKERYMAEGGGKAAKRILVIGAGDAGEMIARDMLKRHGEYEPIGFVDDNAAMKGLSIHGLPIMGTTKDLPWIIRRSRPEEVLIAIPSAKPAMLHAMMDSLSTYKLPITTLPNMREVINGNVSVSQIRPLELEDLLTRPPVKVDARMLGRFIKGKTVMVTGAGGSIGSEISRQCLSLGAAALVAYERHENSLYNLDMELRTKMRGAPFYPVIGDVNDRNRVEETLRDFAPDIIFHAAAHKHVPMMEANPREAIYNNVLGTRTVAFLASQFGVDSFVLISTDKAVNPTSMMGATKRACELMVKALSEGSSTKFLTVRFGNVLGSSGSVVPLFKKQIGMGGPVTVTHPDIERFLMLIPEAVQLVLEAASIGDGGETFVLDMGEPMKIADLARHMVVLSGYEPDKDIKIVYTGLRPGEKLYEELFDKSEDVSLTSAHKIFRAVPRELPDRESILSCGQMLEQCIFMKDTEGMLRVLSQIVDNYIYVPQEGSYQHQQRDAA